MPTSFSQQCGVFKMATDDHCINHLKLRGCHRTDGVLTSHFSFRWLPSWKNRKQLLCPDLCSRWFTFVLFPYPLPRSGCIGYPFTCHYLSHGGIKTKRGTLSHRLGPCVCMCVAMVSASGGLGIGDNRFDLRKKKHLANGNKNARRIFCCHLDAWTSPWSPSVVCQLETAQYSTLSESIYIYIYIYISDYFYGITHVQMFSSFSHWKQEKKYVGKCYCK